MGHGLKTYHDALDFLYGRTTGKWKLGLERVQALMLALGAPHLTRRALARPLEPAPPIRLLSADSRHGAISREARTRAVTQRLEALWRDWEAACRS